MLLYRALTNVAFYLTQCSSVLMWSAPSCVRIAHAVFRRGGRGRHSYVFTRSTGMISWMGFQLFAAVPFLYELREILDWSSTATTLRLFDWIKLQVRYARNYAYTRCESLHLVYLSSETVLEAPEWL